MSRGTPTTTSYAILGLLALKPWSTYELTRQMDRSLGRFWPRATSKLYEEPKKLVEHGLARATKERVGLRARTVYTITPKGRRALASWLHEPGAGPVLEFEQLLKVFFSDQGTKADALASIKAAYTWATSLSRATAAVGREYSEGPGPFPERAPQLNITVRFLVDFYVLVAEWAEWAGGIVEEWPDDPREATIDPAVVADVISRAEQAAARSAVSFEGPRDREHVPR